MLKWMKLKNLALVDEAEVEFGTGFNVVTGETGAGKSVIMGAVGLLLGERADHSAIRAGAEKCEISAEFQLPKYAASDVAALLQQAEIEQDMPGNLLIRRVIGKTGSRNFVNGAPVPLQFLHAIGERMIDVHAANSAYSLMHAAEQLAVLDRFGKLDGLRNEVRNAWDALQSVRTEQELFLRSMPSAEEAERFRRDAGEIRNVDPRPGEDEELKRKHTIASHSRSIMELSYRTGEVLNGDEGSISSLLADARRMLLELERYDEQAGPEFMERIEDIAEKVSSLASDLASHAADIELDESEFQAMEDRMRVLQTIRRRYGPEIEDVLTHLQELENKIRAFDDAAQIREQFALREKALYAQWKAAAERLSSRRKETAKKLAAKLSDETAKLGFLQAKFDIPIADAPDGPGGFDRAEIFFTANPGTPLRPLRDTASSGEIARVMLAVKTVLAEADAIPVLIFDEIDANIGGETAVRVGKELAKLGTRKQVICISHLAQAARAADAHFLVRKDLENGTAHTRIRRIEGEDRVLELARMLGGGKAAIDHARELLKKE